MRTSRKLTVGAMGLVYALVFGEVFVRAFAPEPLLPRNVTGSDWGVRQNVPGAQYRQLTEDVDVDVRINSQGMRADRDYPPQPPAGTCRIAITGDSFIVGYEANVEDIIAGRLDRAMAQRGYRTETLNFGVSGFGNAEELVQFERRIASFHPTILVQGFHTTDFEDNRRSGLFALTSSGALEPRANAYLPGVAISDRLSAIPPYRWLDANSQLFAALRQKATDAAKRAMVALRTGNFGRTELNADKKTDTPANETAPDYDALSSALLRATHASARDRDIGWILFEIPVREGEGRYSSPLAKVKLDPELRQRVVSPIEVFRARPDVAMYQPNGHGHFTPEGNRVGAELIADALVRQERERLASCAHNAAPANETIRADARKVA